MGKSSNFFGQPIYGQLIKSLNREKIVEMSRKHGGEKYVKSFDGYTHLLTMLYAVILRFDSFMLAPSHYKRDEISAMDRAYINYAKFEELTDRGVVYVTKMKKNLNYEVLVDCMHQNSQGLMEYREQVVVFRKDEINHIARLITYVDIKKGKQPKLITLLTNDFDMPLETIVAIYRRRWQIESLFKQIKQNFPLRYFYGESANAIKIQIWVTLIANLLLSVLQSKLKRRWSFSGLATIVRIVLMYYLDLEKFLNQPDADLNIMLADASESPPESTQI